MPEWFTRRLWWRGVLFGILLSQFIQMFSGAWNIRDLIALAVLTPAVVTLHPIMDQPVKMFGPKILSRRFYIGCGLAAVASVVNVAIFQ